MKHNYLKGTSFAFSLMLLLILVFGGIPFYAQNSRTGTANVNSRHGGEILDSDSIFLHYTQQDFSLVMCDLYCYYEGALFQMPSEKQAAELKKMQEIADKYNSKNLHNEHQFISALLLPDDSISDFSNKLELLKNIVEDATKRNDQILKLRSLEAIFNLYWTKKDYAKAFQQIAILDKELPKISDDKYPAKGTVYYSMGEAHYFFRDYDKAVSYLQKAVKPVKYFFDTSPIQAQNLLGEYYALKENVDSANYYFRQAYFSSGKIKNRSILDAISLSNIGYVFLLNKDYNRAIEYMEPSMSYLVDMEQYDAASNIGLRLADCYMAQDDLKKTKAIIDSVSLYMAAGELSDQRGNLYTIRGKYYARVGNSALSNAYMDSAFVANREYETKYDRLNILRAEQRVLEEEAQAKAEEFRLREISHNTTLAYLYSIIIFVALMIVVGLIIVYLNKRKKEKLLGQSGMFSDNNTVDSGNNPDTFLTEAVQELSVNGNGGSDNNGNIVIQDTRVILQSNDRGPVVDSHTQEEPPTEEELLLMEEVTALIEKDEIYKDLDLTLDMLAKKLNVKRNYLSKAINHITGKNFNTYINEYRVKEAIRILSDKKSDIISIDAIALEVGFNNRISFYQSFKKITGLSPSEFRNNRDVGEIVMS